MYAASGWTSTDEMYWKENYRLWMAALRQFGANRLLYGSDYPVCTTLGQTYADTVAVLRALVALLSASEQQAITDSTARRVYRL